MSTSEALTRKARSIQFVKQLGLEANDHLPPIIDSEKVNIRSTQEIAERVTMLTITNMVAFNGMTAQQALDYIHQYQIQHLLTAKEQEFLNNPTQQAKTAETWKAEGIWVLLWALQIVDELGSAANMCDLNRIPEKDYPIAPNKDPNDFIKQQNTIRTTAEILDMADLYYRIDWACVDARLQETTLQVVNSGIVYERHYALNWLINYREQEWDNISCDT